MMFEKNKKYLSAARKSVVSILLLAASCAAYQAEPGVWGFLLLSNTNADPAASARIQITQSTGSTAVTEGGGSDTYSLGPVFAPSADVQISVVFDSTQIRLNGSAVSPLVLTFTPLNWASAQTITVSAIDDSSIEGSHAAVIQHTSVSLDPAFNGLSLSSISVSITDNDSAGVSISESGGSTAVSESSGYDSYNVVLTAAPTASVTVSLAFDTGQLKLNSLSTTPLALTFTTANWSTPQTVIVRAVDDSLVEGSHNSSISYVVSSTDAAYNGIAIGATVVSITDNDSSGVVITQSGGSTNLTEGSGSDSYDVVLTTNPGGAVSISISFDTAQFTINGSGVSPVVLSFSAANYYIPQTVTVAALNDGLIEGLHNSTITHTAAGAGGYAGVTIGSVIPAITDVNGPGVSVVESGGSSQVGEGSTTDSYTLVLTSAPASTVNVAVQFDTAQITINGSSVSPQTLTFTTANWSTPQTVIVAAVDDALIEGTHSALLSHTVSSSDANYNAISAAGVTVGIVDDDITPLVSGGVQTALMDTNSSTTAAITAVDLSKAFVMCYFTSSSSTMYNVPTCQLSAANTVSIAKGGGADSIKVRYYVMEFASGAAVQRGSFSMAAGDASANVTLGSAVDLSRSFVIQYARTAAGGTNADERRLLKAVLTSTTNLQFSRGDTGAALDVEWQVVELEGAQVQSGTATIANGSTATIAPLGAYDTGSSFLIFNYAAGILGGNESNYLVTGNLSSSTSLTFARQTTNQQIDIAWYLVEMLNGPHIQNGSINVLGTETDATAALSPAVNPAFTMPIISFNLASTADAASIDAGFFRPEINATNQLTVHRHVTESKVCTVDWYTIELTSQ
ncbi:MAG: hypothetical protein KDK39_16565 [Leptospiraceae bacterium]|nr:hypothetical protein [Leptospiraceae bacterium]